MIEFILNGETQKYEGDPQFSLLRYLRETAELISPKDGCAPQGACGACTVAVNGKATISCTMPMRKVAGKEVVTTEGWDRSWQETLSGAFVEKGAVQCGFCIPAMAVRAKALLEQNPQPSFLEIQKAITPSLCRCTGYTKIIEAIELSAQLRRENRLPLEQEVKERAKVGQRFPKYNSRSVVLGQRPYVDDLSFPEMRHMALRLSDHPRAKVLQINIEKAKALEGVERVLTSSDLPGKRFIGLIKADWPLFVAPGETTHYVGDVLAAVVAKDKDIARQAVELIEVEYKVLEPVCDMEKALRVDSPLVHEKNKKQENQETNLLDTCLVQRGGDIDKALAQCAFLVDEVYETQRIEHAYMEPEAAIARPLGEELEVYSQGQGVYEDQRQIADLLGLPLENVNVILVPNGGGFGGKEDLSIQGHVALAAYLLQVPVKITLTREESIRMSIKRHPLRLHYILGCDQEGKLKALKARIIGDTGAYASVGMKVLERAAGHATGAYYVPAVDIEAKTVYTNNCPAGAMRGFGANQANFALESAIDELCQKGEFDRWQFRYDNALDNGSCTSTGQVLHQGVGVKASLLALKEDFYRANYTGLACGIKNTGVGNGSPDSSKVKIIIESPEKVILYHGWTEMGQGVHTVAIQFLCEQTGLDPKIIEVRVESKVAEAHAGMTTASRATSLVGNAIINASQKLNKDLQTNSLAELKGKEYFGEWRCDFTTKPGQKNEQQEIVTHYSYSYASQLIILDEKGKVEEIIAAHDAGKIINPTLFEGQIEGSLHMGLGYALQEDCPIENAQPTRLKLKDCQIIRAKEMPKMTVKGLEVHDLLGPYGAKGVGEIGLVPTAPAVANAFFQYDGVRRRKLPLARR